MPDREAWSGRRYPTPTTEELMAARKKMEAPIEVRADVVQGWMCDDCDDWRTKTEAGKLRYGCPKCGGKSFTPMAARQCRHCHVLVPDANAPEHWENCGAR